MTKVYLSRINGNTIIRCTEFGVLYRISAFLSHTYIVKSHDRNSIIINDYVMPEAELQSLINEDLNPETVKIQIE